MRGLAPTKNVPKTLADLDDRVISDLLPATTENEGSGHFDGGHDLGDRDVHLWRSDDQLQVELLTFRIASARRLEEPIVEPPTSTAVIGGGGTPNRLLPRL